MQMRTREEPCRNPLFFTSISAYPPISFPVQACTDYLEVLKMGNTEEEKSRKKNVGLFKVESPSIKDCLKGLMKNKERKVIVKDISHPKVEVMNLIFVTPINTFPPSTSGAADEGFHQSNAEVPSSSEDYPNPFEQLYTKKQRTRRLNEVYSSKVIIPFAFSMPRKKKDGPSTINKTHSPSNIQEESPKLGIIGPEGSPEEEMDDFSFLSEERLERPLLKNL
ncbi:hypothetical protein Cgig2_028940 [Carnegiea gigantea]|uniref:Uncharacterized protein n=1 Tax=Carnegiea gigantea TaxID=171969 RepID=A0A9Q1QNA0_9CARY|nr:hypothetical protein Cgig2_028940 [Carnegiea gigantea]